MAHWMEVTGGTGPSSFFRCKLSRLRCHGHSLFLSSYLCRIKRKENSYAAPADTLCRIWLAPWLSRIWASLALLPFLTSGPDLGAWPDCWASVEFLHAPITRKGSSSTTTTTTTRSATTQLVIWKNVLFQWFRTVFLFYFSDDYNIHHNTLPPPPPLFCT